jgi:hypothetical protein
MFGHRPPIERRRYLIHGEAHGDALEWQVQRAARGQVLDNGLTFGDARGLTHFLSEIE